MEYGPPDGGSRAAPVPARAAPGGRLSWGGWTTIPLCSCWCSPSRTRRRRAAAPPVPGPLATLFPRGSRAGSSVAIEGAAAASLLLSLAELGRLLVIAACRLECGLDPAPPRPRPGRRRPAPAGALRSGPRVGVLVWLPSLTPNPVVWQPGSHCRHPGRHPARSRRVTLRAVTQGWAGLGPARGGCAGAASKSSPRVHFAGHHRGAAAERHDRGCSAAPCGPRGARARLEEGRLMSTTRTIAVTVLRAARGTGPPPTPQRELRRKVKLRLRLRVRPFVLPTFCYCLI